MRNVDDNIITSEITAREALKMLDTAPEGYKTLFVVDADKKLIGTLSDGDIRRGLISGANIDASIECFIFKKFRYLNKSTVSLEEIGALKANNILLIPILDESGKIEKVIDLVKKLSFLPVDAIIMAGGRGERLRPLTDKVPKPLLKVGSKPIIEHNIDRLISYGIDNINISIKYLGEQLIEYLGNGSQKATSISYIKETEPLGTIGAVRLCQNLFHDNLLVMNSDLLTNINFEDFFKYFLSNEADMAVATVPYKVNIPYAVLDVEDKRIKSFKEKPVYTYYSNAGIYLLRKSILKYIPKGKAYNATDLMEYLIQNHHKVISYPILEYWLDIGKLEDYKKAEEDIKHLKF